MIIAHECVFVAQCQVNGSLTKWVDPCKAAASGHLNAGLQLGFKCQGLGAVWPDRHVWRALTLFQANKRAQASGGALALL